jgi:hypothetical protein
MIIILNSHLLYFVAFSGLYRIYPGFNKKYLYNIDILAKMNPDKSTQMSLKRIVFTFGYQIPMYIKNFAEYIFSFIFNVI